MRSPTVRLGLKSQCVKTRRNLALCPKVSNKAIDLNHRTPSLICPSIISVFRIHKTTKSLDLTRLKHGGAAGRKPRDSSPTPRSRRSDKEQPTYLFSFILFPRRLADTSVMTEISEHEFTVIASILDDRSGPELATDRERDLASELQEYAEEKIVNNPKTPSEVAVPKKGCKIRIRNLVFDCWMFCGMSNAWDWRSEDIWNAFEEFRKNDPIYELSSKSSPVPISQGRRRLAHRLRKLHAELH